MCKMWNSSCACVLSACSLPVSSPMWYRSNHQLHQALTEWMTKVFGNTSVASAADTHPPIHPPGLQCHPRVRPRHQDTKLTLMSHNRSGCVAIEVPLLFLFRGLCSVSILFARLPSCFVMQMKT